MYILKDQIYIVLLVKSELQLNKVIKQCKTTNMNEQAIKSIYFKYLNYKTTIVRLSSLNTSVLEIKKKIFTS